jgi:hypothetical protein
MPLLTRLRYALYLAIVSAAAASLIVALASADAVGLLPGSAFQALFSPFFFLVVYAAAFVLAPWVARRLPIADDPPRSTPSGKQPFGYSLRSLALVAIGLALAMLANLVVLLLGRFA